MKQKSMLVLCFFIGILAGTFWAGMIKEDAKEEIGALNRMLFSVNLPKERAGIYWNLWLKRETEAVFLWLTGMTVLAVPGFLLAALYAGFSAAVILSLMTIQCGIFGLPVYLLSLFPQAVCYIPVLAVLCFWGMNRQRKPHLAGFFILSLLLLCGAFFEVYLNPFIMRIFRRF